MKEHFRAAAFSVAFGVASFAAVSAAQAQLVVGTYGGTWLDNSKLCFGDAFEKATGAKVTYVAGSSVQNLAKLRATKGRSELDVASMDLQIAKQAKAEGLFSKLDAAKLSHLAEQTDAALDADNMFVGMSYSSLAFAYNPKTVKDVPTSWNDLWNPAFKGKLSLPDISQTGGQQLLVAITRLKGGTLENTDTAFAAIKELKSSWVTLWTQPDQVIALMERGDIVLAPWYSDRIGAAAARGLPVAVSFPKEGAIGSIGAVGIPSGSKNVELAHKYIDVTLSAEGQKCFAEKQYSGPTNKNVVLQPELAKTVPYGAVRDALVIPDVEEMARRLPQWAERWGREIAR